MYFKQMLVTPDMARDWLATSAGNRRLRGGRIKNAVSDMISGEWTESPQPICFNKSGELIDGHHRLTAIVASGVTVPLAVAYDVPQNAVIDKGLERDTGDALYMRHLISKEASKQSVVAVARRYLELAGAGRKLPDSKMVGFLNENEEAISQSISLSGIGANHAICRKASVQSAIFGAIKCGVPKEILSQFCNVCNTGFMDDATQSAAIVLRNFINTQRMIGYGSTALNELSMFSQMAIRDFANGTPRKIRYVKLKNIYIPNLAAVKEEI